VQESDKQLLHRQHAGENFRCEGRIAQHLRLPFVHSTVKRAVAIVLVQRVTRDGDSLVTVAA
jgi:hypothetical protein